LVVGVLNLKSNCARRRAQRGCSLTQVQPTQSPGYRTSTNHHSPRLPPESTNAVAVRADVRSVDQKYWVYNDELRLCFSCHRSAGRRHYDAHPCARHAHSKRCHSRNTRAGSTQTAAQRRGSRSSPCRRCSDGQQKGASRGGQQSRRDCIGLFAGFLRDNRR
jgi:hypothetical protein